MAGEHRAERWQIEVDAAACTGSGLCVGCAPHQFELGPEHRSRVKHAVIAADDAVADAAECCPMEAIRIVALESGRQLYPPEDDWSPAASTTGRGGRR